MLELTLAILTFLGVAVTFLGLARLLGGNSSLETRLGMLSSTVATPSRGRKGRPRSSLTDNLNRSIARRSWAQQTARELAQANLRLTPAEYLIIEVITAIIATMIGYILTRSFLVAVAAGAVGTLLPGLYVKRRKSGRRKAFDSQLADTVMMMANALRGGFSLLQAMDLVSREAPSPTAEEFTRVIREVGLGLAPEEALEHMVQRIGSDDLDIMVTAINIQHEVGGNLAQVLDTIGHTIRERVRIKGEIAALTATQRWSGYLIAALPLLLALGIHLMNPDYLMPLMEVPYIVLPIFGGFMLLMGFLSIRKIVDIKV